MLITQDERRVFRRMDVEADVKITKGDVELPGICQDLSSTGMSIEIAPGGLQAGDKISVLLDTKDSRFTPLDAQASVVRVFEKEGRYIAAIEFTTFK